MLYTIIGIILLLVKRTSTSINVNEELWKKAKMEAIKRGITVTDLFEKALEKEIQSN